MCLVLSAFVGLTSDYDFKHRHPNGYPMPAMQACAFDRYHFGRPGTGRIAIGLYSTFLHRWFQIFPRDQFLVLRLEDFNADPATHLRDLVAWLGLPEPTPQNWAALLVDRTFNEHRVHRSDILQDTKKLLETFYEPFNDILAALLAPGGSKGLLLNPSGWQAAVASSYVLDPDSLQGVPHGPGPVPASSTSLVLDDGGFPGDPNSARFLWTNLSVVASEPAMRSMWHSQRLAAHELHDPRGFEHGMANRAKVSGGGGQVGSSIGLSRSNGKNPSSRFNGFSDGPAKFMGNGNGAIFDRPSSPKLPPRRFLPGGRDSLMELADSEIISGDGDDHEHLPPN
jgi:hypothetical protein